MKGKQAGDAAEMLACRFLSDRGWRLLQRNFRCKGGEIDLVMMDDMNQLVFIEVRYRRRTDYGRAFETVDRVKRRRISRCAQTWLNLHNAHRLPSRFDVVAIEGASGREQITWIRDAFEYSA